MGESTAKSILIGLAIGIPVGGVVALAATSIHRSLINSAVKQSVTKT